jgi:hypothetical protein
MTQMTNEVHQNIVALATKLKKEEEIEQLINSMEKKDHIRESLLDEQLKSTIQQTKEKMDQLLLVRDTYESTLQNEIIAKNLELQQQKVDLENNYKEMIEQRVNSAVEEYKQSEPILQVATDPELMRHFNTFVERARQNVATMPLPSDEQAYIETTATINLFNEMERMIGEELLAVVPEPYQDNNIDDDQDMIESGPSSTSSTRSVDNEKVTPGNIDAIWAEVVLEEMKKGKETMTTNGLRELNQIRQEIKTEMKTEPTEFTNFDSARIEHAINETMGLINQNLDLVQRFTLNQLTLSEQDAAAIKLSAHIKSMEKSFSRIIKLLPHDGDGNLTPATAEQVSLGLNGFIAISDELEVIHSKYRKDKERGKLIASVTSSLKEIQNKRIHNSKDLVRILMQMSLAVGVMSRSNDNFKTEYDAYTRPKKSLKRQRTTG